MILPLMADISSTERIGVEIRVAMLRRGLSQTELAERVGMSQAALSRRLSGEVPLDVDQLDAIAKALETTPASLLEEKAS